MNDYSYTIGDKFEVEVDFFTGRRVIGKLVKHNKDGSFTLTITDNGEEMVLRRRGDLRERSNDLPTGFVTHISDPVELVEYRQKVFGK